MKILILIFILIFSFNVNSAGRGQLYDLTSDRISSYAVPVIIEDLIGATTWDKVEVYTDGNRFEQYTFTNAGTFATAIEITLLGENSYDIKTITEGLVDEGDSEPLVTPQGEPLVVE